MIDSDRNFEDELNEVLTHMQATVVAAIEEVHEAFAEIMSAAGSNESPPPRQFFASRVMQLAYCVQCRADIQKFQGAPEVAWHAIKNAVDISNHYWGSKFELRKE